MKVRLREIKPGGVFQKTDILGGTRIYVMARPGKMLDLKTFTLFMIDDYTQEVEFLDDVRLCLGPKF